MDRIKDALTRKFGPLPAWAWLIIFAGAVYWYRKRQASSSTSTPATDTSTATPQDPITLDPGQSVYDPNTGALSTAPGGDTSGGGTTDGTGTFTTLPGVGSGLPPIASLIPGGIAKIVTKKKAKPKVNHKPGKTTKPTSKRGRPRSTAGISHKVRTPFSTGPTVAKSVRARELQPRASAGTRSASRVKIPATTTTLQQHPATGLRPPAKPVTHNPPRPSAPPKRTIRKRK